MGVLLQKVEKSFGEVKIIHQVDLTINEGEFVVFVGPSGCGKSTLLRLISGLEELSDGTISIGGKDVSHAAPAERGVAMVFQSYALYPHMSVEENMSFALRMNKMPKDEIEKRVARAADILHLQPYLKRTPKQLSGGQRQRVAIGRAIVREPKVFLFDEPLSNLDAELRVQMRLEIAKLHQQLAATMIYVTHDQTEAMTLADKIVVLRAGKVEQIGAPLDLYNNPDNMFVAGFVGSPKMNFLNGNMEEGKKLKLGDGSILPFTLVQAPAPGNKIVLGIRPEHIRLQEQPGDFALSARIDLVEHLGSVMHLHSRMSDGTPIIIEQKEAGRMAPGQDLKFFFQPADARFFDQDGQRLR